MSYEASDLWQRECGVPRRWRPRRSRGRFDRAPCSQGLALHLSEAQTGALGAAASLKPDTTGISSTTRSTFKEAPKYPPQRADFNFSLFSNEASFEIVFDSRLNTCNSLSLTENSLLNLDKEIWGKSTIPGLKDTSSLN